MDEPSAHEHKHSSLNRESSSSNHLEEDEKTISEGSISEHLTSASASVENDRSLHEIEFSNNLSALPNCQQESNDHSLDLSSFGGNVSNGLPDNNDQINNSGGEGSKNVKSILEEILSNNEFHSNTDGSKEESFNLFANLDLSDKSLINLSDNVKDSAIAGSFDTAAVKDSAINALSQEMDSFREMSNPTCMSSMVSATEYKQLQDECHAKLLEYNSAINSKNDLIQQLSESLRQSTTQQKKLNEQVECFKEQITQLQLQLQETSKMMEEHQCALPDTCSNVSESKHQTVSIKDQQNLMELKLELEKKHAKEMEELRTYFEKKCAELEKNYSEEIFSQHSRKLSDSSSEVELSADYLLSSQPGPGGDLKRVFKSKEDIKRLLDNLNTFAKKLSKHSLEEINDKGLANIEIEVKNELNALFKIGEKLEIQAVESKYKEEISNLRFQLEEERKGHGNLSMGSVIQEVANSGDYELNEVVESYERRLQEQIAMAEIDIINCLKVQIQRLASNEADDEDWPPELLQLRDQFTNKYEKEIQELKNQHETEVAKLKNEHLKMLNGALERARRRSLKEGDSLTKTDVELLKERDNLKRQVVFQRNMLTELVKYFLDAEDELNNTLVENLIKQGNETLLDPVEEPDNSSGATTVNSSKIFDSISNKARVHFAPNIRELLDMIEHQSQQDDESLDVSVELKNELGMCLEKLKQEANAILALSSQPKKCDTVVLSSEQDVDVRLQSLTKQLHFETQRNSQLKSELLDSNQIITSLQKEKESLENRVEQLLERVNMFESELSQAKSRIADLIEGRTSEVVSEGYGEAGHSIMQGLDDTTAALAALQEKAQTMLVQSRASADPAVLQLIEELCQVSETVKEEAKKESKDLLQQIEAADKKYKTTQKFLEEQAAEREQERDEAQRIIDSLHDQLKDRDKDRVNCQIMSKEADQLEQRIADLNHHLTDQQVKYKELESERDEAVEKIKILRDIIRELEQVNDAKDRDLEEQLRQVERLECIVNEQRATFDDYTSRSSFGDVSDVQKLRQQCEQLEEEVQQLRIGAELAGSEGALKQLKLQIFEIEASLDKKTKALELLHSSGTNCSSPSEDMSVRDLIRPQTAVMDECEVPLQQLARLKEKLLRHSRAEEAAIKRIHDLEMELTGLKNELEEVGNEKEVMKRQIQEQVVLISDFQIRLDQQRIKAEHIERQTNSSLETKIYDQQNEISLLQEKLRSREKTLAQHEQMVEQLSQRVKELEEELANPREDDVIVELQKHLDALRMENQILKEKPSSESQILPSLMENILQDKNSDIEKLKAKLTETERQLLSYTSLNLDRNDLKTLADLKNSGGSIEQLISILDLSSPAFDRARHCVNESAFIQKPIIFRKNDVTESLDCSSLPEISSIQRTGNNFNFTADTPLGKPNSTELSHKSAGKRVRFETSESNIIESLTNELETLKLDLENKNKSIAELEAKLRVLHDLEEQIGRLQSRLDETEAALVTATETFEKEKEDSLDKEQKLGVELAEKKLTIDRLEKEVQALKDDSVRKDEMHLNLAREKRDLEEQLLLQKRESFDNLNQALEEKNAMIQNLQLTQKKLQEELEQAFSNLSEAHNQIEQLKSEMLNLEKRSTQETNDYKMELVTRNNCIQQMKTDFNDQIATLKSTIEDLRKRVTDKDTKIKDSACEIDILNEDLKYYQNELAEVTEKLKRYESPNIERQETKLAQEVNHLQELIREKDRMIAQMTEDHNTVHAKLEVVNNKITETGNIFDLSKRLRQEQKKNADLLASIQKLKAALWNYEVEVANAAPMEEITGQVKRELECAAQIDSNILNAVSDKSLSSISEGQDSEIYMKALTRQKNQNKQLMRNNDRLEKQRLALEQQCNQFEMRVNEIQNELDKEKLHNRRVMIEDAKLMEQLRLKLEASIDFQKALEKLLEEEKRCRRMLEIKCEELKKPTSSSESTKYKSLPTQDCLEVAQLKQALESIKEEKDKWCKEVKTLRLENDELKSDIKYAQQMLALEAERNRAHEEKFRVLAEKEKSLNDELLKKRFELEIKEREMEEKKIKMDELEQEKTVLEKQKSKLVKVLKTQSQMPALAPEGAQIVPEQLASLIAELKQKSDENKKRLEHIEKIEKEKTELEKQLRAEVKKNVDGNMPYADLVARCNYLFAKSLKLESVRKALTWQKRYLVDYVKSYQIQFSIGILPNQPHDSHCLRHRHSPLTYFRAAVYAVISIHRMKFLVRRWHTGKRKYDKINARHYRTSTEQYLRENQGANFQVGQPVSNQIFYQNTATFNSNNPFRVDSYHDESRTASPVLSAPFIMRDIPWSGNSPPSKDFQHPRIGGVRETYAPLRAPELLNQLHERVEQVQERLSLPLRTDPT